MIIQCFRKSFLFVVSSILFLGSLYAAAPAPAATQITFPVNAPGAQASLRGQAVNLMLGENLVQRHQTFIRFLRNGYNIFFPADGLQPSTRIASALSCANVNDPAITNWYMQMFGCTDPVFVGVGAVAVQNGFGPLGAVGPQAPCLIITFDATVMPAQQTAFWTEFQRIASDPVGRVFLYRLLIEIRRQDAAGNGYEALAAGSVERNNARSLLIQYGASADDWANSPAYNLGRASITVNFDPPPLISPPVDTLATSADLNDPPAAGTCHTTDVSPYSLVCALFHEMLHWYQQLRDEARFHSENDKLYSEIANNDLSVDFGYPHPGISPHPFESWSDFVVCLDELRVICGAGQGHACPYKEGDDLSEDAFRCSRGLKMRFGHGDEIRTANLQVDTAIRAAHNFARACVTNIIPGFVGWNLTRVQALHP